MPRIDNKKQTILDNDLYKMDILYNPDYQLRRTYWVDDKLDGSKQKLQIEITEECANLAGKIDLIYQKDDNPTIKLSAVRPSGDERKANNDFSTPIGGKRMHGTDKNWHFTQDNNAIMSIYQALQENSFEKTNNTDISAHEASKEILGFFDKYFFNNDGSREVLNDYLVENSKPAPKAPKEPVEQNKLSHIRKKVAQKIDKVAEKTGIKLNLTEKKLPEKIKGIEKKVYDKFFPSKGR